MKTDLPIEATTNYAESFSGRLDYELLAAWRMGFGYRHVWTQHWDAGDLKMSGLTREKVQEVRNTTGKR